MSFGKRTPHRVSPAEPITSADVRGWWIPDAGFAALRIFVALMLIAHGLRDHFGFLTLGEPWLGAPAPLTDRWIAATLLLTGGTLLIVGWLTRAASLVLAVVVVLGYYAPAAARGHWALRGGELVALFTGILISFMLIGAGMFSVDTMRANRPRRRKATMTVSMSPWIKRQYRRRELTR